jgi:hypothetical protein
VFYYWNFQEQKRNQFGDDELPIQAYLVGWALATAGLIQLPAFALYKIFTYSAPTLQEKIRGAFRPLDNWGPEDEKLQAEYILFLRHAD